MSLCNNAATAPKADKVRSYILLLLLKGMSPLGSNIEIH